MPGWSLQMKTATGGKRGQVHFLQRFSLVIGKLRLVKCTCPLFLPFSDAANLLCALLAAAPDSARLVGAPLSPSLVRDALRGLDHDQLLVHGALDGAQRDRGIERREHRCVANCECQQIDVRKRPAKDTGIRARGLLRSVIGGASLAKFFPASRGEFVDA